MKEEVPQLSSFPVVSGLIKEDPLAKTLLFLVFSAHEVRLVSMSNGFRIRCPCGISVSRSLVAPVSRSVGISQDTLLVDVLGAAYDEHIECAPSCGVWRAFVADLSSFSVPTTEAQIERFQALSVERSLKSLAALSTD